MSNEEKDLIEQLAEEYDFQPEAVQELFFGRGDDEQQ